MNVVLPASQPDQRDRTLYVKVLLSSLQYTILFEQKPDILWAKAESKLTPIRIIKAHPAYYLMGTGVSCPGGKAAGAWNWPLTSINCRG
jgi:hypothetical protein